MERVCFVDVADCLRRKIDSIRVKKYLSLNGYMLVGSPEVADYIFINTCGVTNNKVDEALETLQRLRGGKHQIIMLGCVVTTDPARVPGDVTKIPINHMEKLDDFFFRGVAFKSVPLPNKSEEDEQLCYFTVCRGCTENCTYCATRKAIGPLKSVPIKDCVVKFNEILSRDPEKIVFDGDNIGAFGKDLRSSLGDLLDALPEMKRDYMLNLDMLHPVYFLESYVSIRTQVQNHNVGFLLVPFQSGNLRILKMMSRRGDIMEVLERLNELRQVDPGVIIGTHIIIGFPSETDDEFGDTLRLLQTAQFDWVRVFCFSDREHTAASKFGGHINEMVMKDRLVKLVEMMKQHSYFAKCNPSGATFCRKRLVLESAYISNPFCLSCYREVIEL